MAAKHKSIDRILLVAVAEPPLVVTSGAIVVTAGGSVSGIHPS